MSDRAKSHMGGGKKSEKKSSGEKPHEIHIKRAHGGGYVVTHHKKHKLGMDNDEPETHVVPDADQLSQHVQSNMGDQPPAGEGPAPDATAQSVSPQQGAPSPMGM